MSERSKVTDEEIQAAFSGTNFGTEEHRLLLVRSVLKVAIGYHCGSTITGIMQRMGLVTAKLKLTVRGKEFCYDEVGLGRSG